MKNNNLQTNWTVKTILLVLLFGIAGLTKGYAYDFSAVCETGQTLYYNITNAEYHYVELTRPASDWLGYTKPTGNIILPKYVYDANGNQYFVTSIGNSAFYGCNGLTGNLTIPNFVTSIERYAFTSCHGFTSITIPNSVVSIGNRVFCSCIGIEQIITESNNTVYDSRNSCNAIIETNTNKLVVGCKNTVIPNTVTKIGNHAFEGCSGLTSVTIPNSVTSIDDFAFISCSGLTTLTIPNSVTTIGDAAFENCSGLTSITIGNSVTLIGYGHFIAGFCDGCSELSSINMLTTTPPILTYTFHGTSNTLKIYVPYESLNAYKTATYWSDYESRIYPMAYKTISGYETSNGNWAFIASPLSANTAPTAIENMITETEYDLYYFDQTGGDNGLEWKNYKAHTNDFTIANGKGYLYANKEDVNLIFKGTFNENSTKTINLIYEAGEPCAGWNLVGNPFPMAATVTGSSYYVMNAEGTQIDPIAVSSGGTINPCTGIMVQATVLGQPITFTRESRQVSNNNGILQIAVAQNNTRSNAIQDKAIVSFNEGDQLGKFVFNKDNAKLYIPQGNEDYAIAYAEKQDEMPLNFEAKESGSYTISVKPESVEINYLHLIDNMTGTDIDLLVTPSYTFESKTNDYASRFRLVFSASGNTDNEDEEPFAFVSNGNIIVTGDCANATLQTVDMLGHVVVSTDVAHNVSTNGIASGVYVLRLINGNYVKTQKIVIR